MWDAESGQELLLLSAPQDSYAVTKVGFGGRLGRPMAGELSRPLKGRFSDIDFRLTPPAILANRIGLSYI